MQLKKLFFILALLGSMLLPAQAQFSGGTAYRIISGSSLPATCTAGPGVADVYVKTGGSPGIYYCSATNTWTLAAGGGGGTGDVVGPASATDNAVVRFDLTTGKLVQNSVVLIDDTGNITGVGTLNTHTIPGGTDTFALLNATQTLASKTLSSPLVSGTLIQTSNAAQAFCSGPNGCTNPVLSTVNNVASAATGVSITGNAAGAGAVVSITSPNATENLTIQAKGSGAAVILGTTSGAQVVQFGSTAGSSIYSTTASGGDINFRSANSTFTFQGAAGATFPSTSGWIELKGAARLFGPSAGVLRLGANGSTTAAGNLLIGTSAGAIGTGGAGVLAFTLSTEPSTSPTDTTQLYYKDFAAGDGRLYLRNEASAAGSPVANLGDAQTFTGRITFSPGATIAGINVGSLAGDPSGPSNGDLWYDSSSNELTARINGANVALGSGGGGGITIGTTTINSGTNTRVLYNNSGVVGEYTVTGTAGNVVLSTSPTITTPAITTSATITRNSIGATSTDGLILENTTAAAAGAQQYSPRIRLTGQGWKTNATAASQAVDWIIENQPVQSTTQPFQQLVFSTAVNGGAYTEMLRMTASAPGVPTNPGTLGGIFEAYRQAGIQFGQYNMQMYAGGTNVFSVRDSGIYVGAVPLFLGNTGVADWRIIRTAAGVARIGGSSATDAGNLLVGTSAGAIGTSGAGVLAFSSSTAPSTSPTDTVQVYSGDAAAADHNLYARNEAGQINRLTGLAVRNSAQFDVTSSTTLATITGLTENVEAGRTYAFRAYVQTSAGAGGIKLAVGGTATATAISYEGELTSDSDDNVVLIDRATALGTTVCDSSTTTTGTCKIEGVIQVNAAGTLVIQFAQSASNGTASSVLANQYLQLIPIS